MGDLVNLTAGRTRPAAPLPKSRDCATCGEPIKPARLKVMPAARRCVACEHGVERELEQLAATADDDTVVVIRR